MRLRLGKQRFSVRPLDRKEREFTIRKPPRQMKIMRLLSSDRHVISVDQPAGFLTAISLHQGWNRYSLKVSPIFDIDTSLKSIVDTFVDIDISKYRYRYSISILRLLKTVRLPHLKD
jgi:hypothetical protein